MYSHITNCSPEYVVSMFNDIAPNYDKLNHILSFGIDYSWRRKMVNALANYQHKSILDLAAGTGDLSLALNKINPDKIVLADPSSQMLSIAKRKLAKSKLFNRFEICQCSAENLPFPSESFDMVTISFGIRNFSNHEKTLSEIHRVLKKNGTLAILEFGMPQKNIFAALYSWYSKNILPKIGRLVSKNFNAYSYLPETISKFPYGENFQKILSDSSFENKKMRKLNTGIAYFYLSVKK